MFCEVVATVARLSGFMTLRIDHSLLKFKKTSKRWNPGRALGSNNNFLDEIDQSMFEGRK